MENAEATLLIERIKTKLGKGDPFAAAIRATRMPMVITDPRLADNPIVFANDAFCRLSGYGREEIMGRNCRFLQGADSDRATVAKVRAAIAARTDIAVDLLNYRKDGTPFWNALHVGPVLGEDGALQYFFASQLDVTDRRDALEIKTMLLHEVDHRVKNNLQIISALVAMEARAMPDPEVARRLTSTLARIEALSIVHRRLYQSDDVTRFDVAGLARDIVTNLVGSTGRDDIAVDLDLEPVHLPADLASPLALVVNELVTNVLKHAFPDGRAGRIGIEVAPTSAGTGDELRISVIDDGVGLTERTQGPASFGRKLVAALSRQLGATTTWGPVEPSGLRVDLRMPLTERPPHRAAGGLEGGPPH